MVAPIVTPIVTPIGTPIGTRIVTPTVPLIVTPTVPSIVTPTVTPAVTPTVILTAIADIHGVEVRLLAAPRVPVPCFARPRVAAPVARQVLAQLGYTLNCSRVGGLPDTACWYTIYVPFGVVCACLVISVLMLRFFVKDPH